MWDVLPYASLADGIPFQGYVYQDIDTLIFPVMQEVKRQPGDLRPRFQTIGEPITVRVWVSIDGSSFSARWTPDFVNGFETAEPMTDERTARRLFPELWQHQFG